MKIFTWFQKKEELSVTEMYYRFVSFPDGSGYAELYSDLNHAIGYAGSFFNKESMFEIIEHLIVTRPPQTEYTTIIKFVYRRG